MTRHTRRTTFIDGSTTDYFTVSPHAFQSARTDVFAAGTWVIYLQKGIFRGPIPHSLATILAMNSAHFLDCNPLSIRSLIYLRVLMLLILKTATSTRISTVVGMAPTSELFNSDFFTQIFTFFYITYTRFH
jgi:hypothetical protein